MKYYAASSFRNISNVRLLTSALNEKGFTQTYDWTKNQHAATIKDLADIGEKEKQAVQDSDFLVVLSPAGKGSHIELGIALGQGKPIYLHSENNDILDFETTSTFYHLDGVKMFVGELPAFIDFILSEQDISNY
ncbi:MULTISPECIES: group-specific protein [Oceanobacillus]|uniref:Group-specific protein n=1 Tax=Oceanobacillus neutriphilus TaxID=531815 RepID=A0ABQ2NVZ5_9BACI|nr:MULTISPECIES: group-specific protein [Oceanobacillus]MCT1904583.1 group-specific protein [Oceanobacillus sojae]GGP11932.1 hypothetical protein GCM10011346_25910 [Oceanobacillus neutriphilus]